MTEFTFTPLTRADLPLLRQWMCQDHWRQWWGQDTDHELNKMEAKIDGDSQTKAFLFRHDRAAIGYVQYWHVKDNQDAASLREYPWMAWFGPNTVGVDMTIGAARNLSKGYGSQAMREFTGLLRSMGHSDIIIDPNRTNMRAIRAYEKAGFKPIPDYKTRTQDCLLMRHHEDTL